PWTLHYTTIDSPTAYGMVWFVLLSGTAISLLLVGFVFNLLNTRFKAEQIASQLTQELRESETKFRLLAENIQDVFWISTPGIDRILYVSPAFERIWDRTCASLYQRPQSFADAIHAEDRDRVNAALQEHTHGSWNVDYRIIRTDGSVRWIQDRGFPVRDKNGALSLMCGVASDITARKQAEEELRLKNLLLTTQQEVTIDGILVVDENNLIISSNRRFAEMWDIPLKLIEDRNDEPVLKLMVSKLADPQSFYQRVQYLYKHRQENSRDEFRLADGRFFDCYSAPLASADGHYYGRVWYFRDITGWKIAEASLRESEQRFRAMVEGSVIPIFVSLEMKFAYLNLAAVQLFGAETPAQLLGQPVLSRIHPDFHESIKQRGEKVEQGRLGAAPAQQEVYFRLDGTSVPVEVTASSIIYEGQPGAVVFVQDITERKIAEATLLVSNHQLIAAVAELKKAQQQMVQQASLRALGQMASGMAHDLNNTLSPIIGFSELLMIHPAKLTDREQALRFLKLINTAGHDAAGMVRRLREFGNQRINYNDVESINLISLIKQVIELTQPRWKDQVQSAGLTIQMVTDLGEIPHIVGEAFAIRELLTNLIFNSVDALSAGGTITLGAAVDRGFVRLWVSDTGTGMTEEVRRRCFEPFFTSKPTGTGLGLAMVHSIVQRHGGTMEITSEPGAGTTVTIWFPIQLIQPQAAQAKASGLARKLRILVVDDEPMVREVVELFLTNAGHTVETVGDGATAVTRLTASPFDLVITDKSMPVMNG
ncbi:MAG: PAS domain S-box protein, partial [Verrucomicrobiota bacterium]